MYIFPERAIADPGLVSITTRSELLAASRIFEDGRDSREGGSGCSHSLLTNSYLYSKRHLGLSTFFWLKSTMFSHLLNFMFSSDELTKCFLPLSKMIFVKVKAIYF